MAADPAAAACQNGAAKPVPGTLASARDGCETRPVSAGKEKRNSEPGVYRSGKTEVRVRGYIRYESGAAAR